MQKNRTTGLVRVVGKLDDRSEAQKVMDSMGSGTMYAAIAALIITIGLCIAGDKETALLGFGATGMATITAIVINAKAWFAK